jgi:hypothetical protein
MLLYNHRRDNNTQPLGIQVLPIGPASGRDVARTRIRATSPGPKVRADGMYVNPECLPFGDVATQKLQRVFYW